MTAPLRRYAAMSDEVEHLDSELSESLAKIRSDIEVRAARAGAGGRGVGTERGSRGAGGMRAVQGAGVAAAGVDAQPALFDAPVRPTRARRNWIGTPSRRARPRARSGRKSCESKPRSTRRARCCKTSRWSYANWTAMILRYIRSPPPPCPRAPRPMRSVLEDARARVPSMRAYARVCPHYCAGFRCYAF